MNTQPTHTIERFGLRDEEEHGYIARGFTLDEIEGWCNDSDPCYEVTEDEMRDIGSDMAVAIRRLRSERTEALNIIANLEQANLLAAKRVGMELSADTPNALAEEILKLRSEREAVRREGQMDGLRWAASLCENIDADFPEDEVEILLLLGSDVRKINIIGKYLAGRIQGLTPQKGTGR